MGRMQMSECPLWSVLFLSIICWPGRQQARVELLPISRKELQPLCKQFFSLVVGLREARAKRALSPCRTGELGPLWGCSPAAYIMGIFLLSRSNLESWGLLPTSENLLNEGLTLKQVQPQHWVLPRGTVTGVTSRSHLPRRDTGWMWQRTESGGTEFIWDWGLFLDMGAIGEFWGYVFEIELDRFVGEGRVIWVVLELNHRTVKRQQTN